VQHEAELVEAVNFAKQRNLPLFVLGGGSNLLVSDAGFDGVVLRVGVRFEGRAPSRESVLLEVGRARTGTTLCSMRSIGYAGIECLAGIPGDVGGTPVQNVGAYGQEVAETILQVRAYDLETGTFVDLDHEACRFGYRRSLFNTEARGRYIVTAVTYKLRSGGEPALRYADVKRYFAAQFERGEKPSLRQVYEAVRSIREQKGMLAGQGGPDGRSAGSFFKNPVIPLAALPQIALKGGCRPDEIPQYPGGNGMVKLAAAWLVEQAGFHKGFAMGRAASHPAHLALVESRRRNRRGTDCSARRGDGAVRQVCDSARTGASYLGTFATLSCSKPRPLSASTSATGLVDYAALTILMTSAFI
jgi:UDP-N-acetylmuramate dehydrogenase